MIIYLGITTKPRVTIGLSMVNINLSVTAIKPLAIIIIVTIVSYHCYFDSHDNENSSSGELLKATSSVIIVNQPTIIDAYQ